MDARRKKVLQTLLLTTIAVQTGLLKKNKSNVPRKRRWSVRPINKFRRQFGYFLNAFKAMKDHDSEAFFKNTRLNLSEFNMLAEMLKPKLTRRSCINTITVKGRLAITLAYLAHGSSMSDVARNYLRGHSTVPGVIKTTCNALWEVLAPVYMAPPTREQWSSIKHEFYERWNMPNCLGAIDGKHIGIQSLMLSGSEYYNYKHFYSIHLMAIVDGDYKFIFVDIGAQGKYGDNGVFRNSNFGSAIITETLNIPQSFLEEFVHKSTKLISYTS